MYGACHSGPKIALPNRSTIQVLHRLFAEVMIDAIDLRFGEMTADRGIDRLRRGKVMTERFFQHDARIAVDYTGGRKGCRRWS